MVDGIWLGCSVVGPKVGDKVGVKDGTLLGNSVLGIDVGDKDGKGEG
jgi:hypothetical protein